MKPTLSDQERPSEDSETKTAILIPKVDDQKEPDEELQLQQSWKPKLDRWSMLPTLIFSSIFCALYEVDKTDLISTRVICLNRKPGVINMHLEGEEIFLLLLNPAVLLLVLRAYIKNDKFYRLFFSKLGIFFIFVTLVSTGWRILYEVITKGPFVSCELRLNVDLEDIFQQGKIDLGGLICTILMVTVILDGYPWMKHKEDEKDDVYVQFLKKYSKSIFTCHLIIVLLSFASIYANIVYEIVFTLIDFYYEVRAFTIYEYNPDRLIWIWSFLAIFAVELFILHSCKKKNDDTKEIICNNGKKIYWLKDKLVLHSGAKSALRPTTELACVVPT